MSWFRTHLKLTFHTGLVSWTQLNMKKCPELVLLAVPLRYPNPPQASLASWMASLAAHVTRGLLQHTIACTPDTMLDCNRHHHHVTSTVNFCSHHRIVNNNMIVKKVNRQKQGWFIVFYSAGADKQVNKPLSSTIALLAHHMDKRLSLNISRPFSAKGKAGKEVELRKERSKDEWEAHEKTVCGR